MQEVCWEWLGWVMGVEKEGITSGMDSCILESDTVIRMAYVVGHFSKLIH